MGSTPFVSAVYQARPSTGHLSIVGSTPAVVIGAGNVTALPSAGALHLIGKVPKIKVTRQSPSVDGGDLLRYLPVKMTAPVFVRPEPARIIMFPSRPDILVGDDQDIMDIIGLIA
jgi:hypothetical protein